MHYYVLTLFPEMITNACGESILGRASQKGLISVEAINIRDYSTNKHNRVDDYPYGGGAGMVMQPMPVYDAWKDLSGKTIFSKAGRRICKGRRFDIPLRSLRGN